MNETNKAPENLLVTEPAPFSDSIKTEQERLIACLRSSTTAMEVAEQRMLVRQHSGLVLLEPMGGELNFADLMHKERTLMSLRGKEVSNYIDKVTQENIRDKRVLVIPAYSTNAFFFTTLKAREIIGVDIDPRTVAWLDLIRQHWGNNSIAPVMIGSVDLPHRLEYKQIEHSIFHETPKFLGEHVISQLIRTYKKGDLPRPLENVSFVQAGLGNLPNGLNDIPTIDQLPTPGFDFIYIPYLIGINHGIADIDSAKKAFEQLWQVANKNAVIVVSPFTDSEQDLLDRFADDNGQLIRNMKDVLPKDKLVVEMTTFGGGEEYGFLRVIKS